jgi:hypothetical protein
MQKKKDEEEKKEIKVEGEGEMAICLKADGDIDSLTTYDYTTTAIGEGCSTILYKIKCILTLTNSANLTVEQPEVVSVEENSDDD